MTDAADAMPVYVIGPHAFQNSMMRRLIQNDRFDCRTYRQLIELPDDALQVNCKRPLIFFDCLGLDRPELLSTIDGKLSGYLHSSHLIMFNVKQDHAVEKYALRKGIKGFLYDHDDSGMLHQVIQTVADGRIWVARQALEECIALLPPPIQSESPGLALTKREREILRLVAAGETNDQIASRLYVSKHTVKCHLHAIYRKIGVSSRVLAAQWGQQNL